MPHHASGFGDVWQCIWSASSSKSPPVTVAIKAVRVLDSSETALLAKAARGLRREAQIWMRLLHDNVLPLEGITEEFGPLPAFVTPWMENGTLEDYLGREVGLSWERKLSMVREIAAGLQYLHGMRIVHGDLTPTNVLLGSDGRLCLGDFGLSTILAESDNATFNSCHTANVRWTPPELVEEAAKPTTSGDVYSYGCIMMQVFSGKRPYASIVSAIHVMAALLRGRKPFSQLATSIGEEIQQFALQCLSTDIVCCPSIGEIVEFLWSQTNIAETMKAMLSQLPVIGTQITQVVLTKCDYHPDGLDVLGAALKCKWVVHGSSETEVAVKTLRDDVNSQNDINKIFNRIRREMYVREKLRHETIIALYGMTEGFGILPSFVYPWMAGGSLHDYMKREHPNLPACRKLDILLEVAHGLEYCKCPAQQPVHRTHVQP
ncbi:kinase-like domain-containing protein [Suillus variegatus]|nr:kinase-like domain-containing protein [Suillus variegatus]